MPSTWLPTPSVRLGTVLLVVLPLVAGGQPPPRTVPAPQDTLRVAIAGPLPSDAWRGLLMSLEESARVAPLLGQAIVLDSSAADTRRAAFVITDAAALPAPPGIVLDVGCSAPPTQAAGRWFGLCPGSRAGAGAQDSVVGWDPALEKYGASQLNDRYRARWDAPMTDGAWRGWLAAKIAWESALRGPRDPAALAHWLASPAARFDGHQGVPLSFDARHRLRHPRYRVLHRGSTRTIEALP